MKKFYVNAQEKIMTDKGLIKTTNTFVVEAFDEKSARVTAYSKLMGNEFIESIFSHDEYMLVNKLKTKK